MRAVLPAVARRGVGCAVRSTCDLYAAVFANAKKRRSEQIDSIMTSTRSPAPSCGRHACASVDRSGSAHHKAAYAATQSAIACGCESVRNSGRFCIFAATLGRNEKTAVGTRRGTEGIPTERVAGREAVCGAGKN